MVGSTRDRTIWTVLGRGVDHVRAEPVAFQGVIQAGLALLVGFGVLGWTAQQTGLALALTAAILSFVARRHVTPSTPTPNTRKSAGADAPAR